MPEFRIIQNIWLLALLCESLKCSAPPGSDACRLAQGRDALISWRALCERSELGRPPQACVPPLLIGTDGASMVLAPFAETKGARPPGRNPASIEHSKNSQVVKCG